MEADEQLGAGVEEPDAQVRHAAAGEERPERERVVEVTGDEHRLQVVAALGDDADGLDDRHLVRGQAAQEPVLLARDVGRQLLERVDGAAVLDEAHDVTVDAALDLDEPLGLPLLERPFPGQVEEVRVAGAGDELQARRHQAPSSCARVRYIACDQSSGQGGGPHFATHGS